MKPTAYEGADPYIFISYSHRDTEDVFRVLEALDAKGYRLWYDDGIAPGSEWPEDIARHLDASAMVIAFVTPQSMDSRNCRREINFALSKEKPFLSVFLEKTEMPLGMEMQLSAQQSIFRYNYAAEEDFLNKILRCPDLAPCKEEQPKISFKEEQPEIIVDSETEDVLREDPAVTFKETPPVKLPYINNDTGHDLTERKEPALTAPVLPAVNSRKKEKRKNVSGNTAPTPRKKLLVPIVLGIAAVLIAVFLLLPRGFKTSWGNNYKSDATSVSVYSEDVTQEDLKKISKLKKLHSLTFSDCNFINCNFDNIHFTSDKVDSVTIQNCTGIEEYGFLSGLPLRFLRLTGCETFKDLSTIDLSNIYSLSLDGTGVTDLSALAGTKISELSFRDTAVTDLTWAAEIPDLNKICGAGSGVTSISSISGLENLTSVDFQGCTLNDVPEEMAALRLRDVNLSDCGLSNADMLRNCSVLVNVILNKNPHLEDVEDLLSRNSKTLEVLDLSETGIRRRSLEALAGSSKLQYISISGIEISNLDFVSEMVELKTLKAENCGISDINALKKLRNLKNILLSFNNIRDISVLRESLKPSLSETVLDLSFNPLTGAGNLPTGEYHTLLLHGTNKKIVLSLPSGLRAYTLSVPWTDDIQNSILEKKGTVYEILLVDCPAPEKVKTEDALGSSYCKFVTGQELMDLLKNNDLEYSFNINYDYPYTVYSKLTE